MLPRTTLNSPFFLNTESAKEFGSRASRFKGQGCSWVRAPNPGPLSSFRRPHKIGWDWLKVDIDVFVYWLGIIYYLKSSHLIWFWLNPKVRLHMGLCTFAPYMHVNMSVHTHVNMSVHIHECARAQSCILRMCTCIILCTSVHMHMHERGRANARAHALA